MAANLRTVSLLVTALGLGGLVTACASSPGTGIGASAEVIAVTSSRPGDVAPVPPPTSAVAPVTTTEAVAASAGSTIRGYDFTKHVFGPDTCSDDTSTGRYVVRPDPALLGDGEVALIGVTYGEVGRGAGEEALVQVRCQGAKGLANAFLFGGGGSGAPERLAVARPDGPMAARLRDAWDIQYFSLGAATLDVAGHTVVVTGSAYTSDDAGCCPSYQLGFRLVNHDRDLWAPQGEEVRRTS
jgi:hypothetical protein